jgi:hypothetical protein
MLFLYTDGKAGQEASIVKVQPWLLSGETYSPSERSFHCGNQFIRRSQTANAFDTTASLMRISAAWSAAKSSVDVLLTTKFRRQVFRKKRQLLLPRVQAMLAPGESVQPTRISEMMGDHCPAADTQPLRISQPLIHDSGSNIIRTG